ncbi:NADH-quinone oxidoreductase subunit G [Gordonia hirsuta DSM 44140 = NBRC 16056]|uniref:NADH-quinone oxidoreductase n=1 Tax=Gordonia hirsuta DSM 44140 = NBRC 16056 TaxID=1121927 RepID=L7LC19_9ACTN|nr:NADH-quinone oxidoreductase subunit G [Gordonia hirsuta]GAC57617.1 NADH-quinone oxidoreductase subunit G [Gordonia hirsuta DSM 44140 = NBRC 16056]
MSDDTRSERPGLVTVTIDDVQVTVPAGTLVIRAAEQLGVDIPRFCDHPLLPPVGACRQCLVEIEGQRKPMPSCTVPVADGMVVRTQHTSAEAERAQRGVMELLLINHPLDCPTCDKGGECPLQNQAMSAGRPVSRFDAVKRTFTKPVPLSAEVLLDRERCVLCARCTRFSTEIAGDPLIEMAERGALQQVVAYQDEPFESYFSGNTVQICPVGALTGVTYRFRARPFDLVSTPSICEHCSAGCAQRTDHRRGRVMRRLAGDDPEVNEEWNCDKGRWAFEYAQLRDRLTVPLVRGEDGTLAPAAWPHALAIAARGLAAAGAATGVLIGGRATVEDAYAYAKFARAVLGSNHVDTRIRAHSAEESDFLAARVAGTGIGLTYPVLETAPVVVLAGLEPEEECPILFLRLRKAVQAGRTQVVTLAPLASPGSVKLSARVLACTPGQEGPWLASTEVAELLARPGAVLLTGERLATAPGALSAAAAVTAATGAALAWVPRRTGERGALDVGAAPNLLPAGRPLASAAARADLAQVWGVTPPADTGRDTAGILAGLGEGTLAAAVTGGVDLADLPDPQAAADALHGAFVVSLELRPSSVTALADVVFPVAAVTEKRGTFVNWEGRPRSFGTALPAPERRTLPLADHRVLHLLAAELGADLGCPDGEAIHREFGRIGPWTGERAAAPAADPAPVPAEPATAEPDASAPDDAPAQWVLASWRMLLDDGSLQEGAPDLAATARRPVVRLSPADAAAIGAADDDLVTVWTDRGELTLPLAITPMVDGVVWVPMRSPGSHLHTALAASPGDRVRVRRRS